MTAKKVIPKGNGITATLTKEVAEKKLLKEESIIYESITIRYDLNWYYMRTKILSLKTIPYLLWSKYCQWFDKTFNTKLNPNNNLLISEYEKGDEQSYER